jgi:hypothetical protein
MKEGTLSNFFKVQGQTIDKSLFISTLDSEGLAS